MDTKQEKPQLKKFKSIASALDDLKEFPEDVQDVMGYALELAQPGKKHPDAKPLGGFSGAGVLEIVDDFDGDTYRAIYTVKFEGFVYLLHSFQKKSKHGISTPKQDIELVEKRLKAAKEDYLQETKRSEANKDGQTE
ncbi:type II toxin-antitoxin system RelE/ParE family toxin [Fortiea sp. LEGE XX443]|uniref:type II toxin-antitoxin system RelE/ParE family toxin n=1 Tax=Fortiea sp. LEGE XX443 TaxID=1828611 RepID=UPI001880D72E|nr:type II toxin-antitoxin system RelE/ParE family toxin [Fortiea sp. LEGE XX443]MBE9006664.1 type II toxin-antitoxin system RelE/ParE family toxin [Fortiea sp. LEGE XX443]